MKIASVIINSAEKQIKGAEIGDRLSFQPETPGSDQPYLSFIHQQISSFFHHL